MTDLTLTGGLKELVVKIDKGKSADGILMDLLQVLVQIQGGESDKAPVTDPRRKENDATGETSLILLFLWHHYMNLNLTPQTHSPNDLFNHHPGNHWVGTALQESPYLLPASH